VRALSKKARGGSDADFATLTRILEQMPVDEALPVARAFSYFLNLANIAEQHHRIRRRRAYQRDADAPPQIGSCDETFGRLIASGVMPDRLYDAVARLRVELVFTAHPTEVTRRTLMQKFGRIAELLALGDHVDLTPPERDELGESLRIEIAAAWETSEVRPRRPSPVDEARSGLAVFEQSLWDAVPRFLRTLNAALVKHTGRGLPPDHSPLRFGSWIGGDRDGNPSVTSMVTATVVLLARWQAASLYLPEVDALRLDLSMRDGSPELTERASGAAEPYREVLRGVRDRLAATLRAIEDRLDRHAVLEPFDYVTAAELAEPLALCRRSLEQTGDGLLARGRLLDLQRRVAAFGARRRLDLRQDASRHGRLGDHAAPGSWRLLVLERDPTAGVPARGAGQQAAARAARPVGVAGSRRGLRDVPRGRAAAARIARRVRHLDDRAALRRPRGGAAAEGSAHALAAAGRRPVRNHVGARRRGPHHRRPAGDPGIARGVRAGRK
jgi:phosphoenolpyruvate carboxylase